MRRTLWNRKSRKPRCREEKRLSTPLLIFIILMAVTAVLCTIVAGIWLHGRSSLRNGGSAPTVTPRRHGQLDSYTVLHDGKYYRYKEHMVNLLLIGVDSDNKPAAPALRQRQPGGRDPGGGSGHRRQQNDPDLRVPGHHVRYRRAG